MIRIIYPQNLNIERLLNDYDLSRTRKRNVMIKCITMVSKVTKTNYNVHRFDSEGFTPISSASKKGLLHNDYELVHDILTAGDNPIIEEKESYKVGEFTKQYRLNPRYRNSALAVFELPEQDYGTDLPFLDSQFTRNHLSLELRVYEYLFNLYSEIERLPLTENQRILFRNYIGRAINIIDDIDNGFLQYHRSRSNLRYNSTITSLNKVVRPFLLCNGRPLVSIDIKASQPYLLASILNDKFFTSKEEGYNISTIYPRGPGAILFPRFLEGKETDIEKFKQSPFDQDFYSYVLRNELGREPTEEEREVMKKKTMEFLFFNNSAARNKGYLVYFKRQIPVIGGIITQFLNIVKSRRFSYLLQRTESYLVLEKVCKDFHKRNPEAPIFTIHDSLLTTVEYADDLYKLMYDTLHSITGIVPGLKMEHPDQSVTPSDKSMNHVLRKIEKRSGKIKHIDEAIEVLEINLKRAGDFINELNTKEK
jgi:hypothetical protein